MGELEGLVIVIALELRGLVVKLEEVVVVGISMREPLAGSSSHRTCLTVISVGIFYSGTIHKTLFGCCYHR